MFAALTVPTFPSLREALALGLLSLCLVATKPAGGQEVTASITGTVYSVRTNSVGVFDLTSVPVGTYELKVEAPGFQSVLYPSLTPVLKEFPLRESRRLEFRAEFFNVANTLILNSPDNFLAFRLGLVESSQGERNIQFALKFYY
jgi:hypothetical protein